MAMATESSSSRITGSLMTVVLAWILLCFVITGVAALVTPIAAPSTLAPSPATPSGAQAERLQLWADQEGEKYFTKCGFNSTISSSLSEYVRSDFGGDSKLMVLKLTELKVMKVMKAM